MAAEARTTSLGAIRRLIVQAGKIGRVCLEMIAQGAFPVVQIIRGDEQDVGPGRIVGLGIHKRVACAAISSRI